MTEKKLATATVTAAKFAVDRDRRVLIVGANSALPRALEQVAGATVILVRFSAIDRTLLDTVRPNVVLAPLFSNDFDITDLAAHLVRLGYDGALRAYTRPLPAPHVVAAEFKADWPKLDFDLIELPNP